MTDAELLLAPVAVVALAAASVLSLRYFETPLRRYLTDAFDRRLQRRPVAVPAISRQEAALDDRGGATSGGLGCGSGSARAPARLGRDLVIDTMRGIAILMVIENPFAAAAARYALGSRCGRSAAALRARVPVRIGIPDRAFRAWCRSLAG